MLTGAEVQGHILKKAEEDAEFRERLFADPKGVIEAETGLILPDDAMTFVQESIAKGQQGTAVDELPLTDDELAQLTGGTVCLDDDWQQIECGTGPSYQRPN